jgi:hypothetical protein
VLFRLEVLGERLAPGRLRLLFLGALDLALLGSLGPLLERPLLLALDDGWGSGCRYLRRCARLALLALRYGEKLGDTLIEACKLLDELGDLITKRGIVTSLRFVLAHRRVQITLGDLCRSSCLLFESRPPVRGALR